MRRLLARAALEHRSDDTTDIIARVRRSRPHRRHTRLSTPPAARAELAGEATGRHLTSPAAAVTTAASPRLIGADVTDERQVAELVAAITDRFGPVDVLVLDVTGPQPDAPVTEVATADHLVQLNFLRQEPGTARPRGADRDGCPAL
jgi:NAD(P)-dependent dehydrogenase (short-subunit alcohol dehydrogenase family)